MCIQCHFTSDCMYTYERQPLTSLECNPYQNDLVLACTVTVRGSTQMAISILWYWEPLNASQPQSLSSSQNTNTGGGGNFQTWSSRLRVKDLNDSDAGQYYCQAKLANGTLLTPSNKLHLAIRSEYTNASKCLSMAHTTEVYSCASIATDDSVTGSTTSPDLATGSNGGSTDPPSSPPTANTNRPSLPTTVNLAPTPTVIPVTIPESNMLQVALYTVISVIVVFCAVIVTLAVTIVILYRRKRGHANFKKTAGSFVMAINCYYGDVCQRGSSVCVYLSTRCLSHYKSFEIALNSLVEKWGMKMVFTSLPSSSSSIHLLT